MWWALQRVVDQVRPFHVAGGVEALDAGQLLGLADPFVGEVAGLFLFLDLEVDALRRRVLRVDLASRSAASEHRQAVALGALSAWPGAFMSFGRALRSSSVSLRAMSSAFSYCRGSLKAGPEMMSGVRASSMRMLSTSSMMAKFSGVRWHCGRYGWELVVVVPGRLHVVAEVVEAEFAAGAVGDVAVVGEALGVAVLVDLDERGAHAQGVVDGQHPLAVAAGEVVVHGDDVNALAFEGVQIRGSVATRVLPSPVTISAMLPVCIMASRRRSARRSAASPSCGGRPRGRRRTPPASCFRAISPFFTRSR